MNKNNLASFRLRLLLSLFIVVALSSCGSDSSDADIKYTALGASDANGLGASPITNGYVFLIQDDLENKGKETSLLDLGIPAAEVRVIKNVELPVAKEANPDLVTLFTGGNDIVGGVSVEDFEKDLETIFRELRENKADTFIVVATLPDITKTERFIDEPDSDVTIARVNAFNAAILRQAAKYSVPIAELRGLSVGGDVTADDGYHPNDEGHQLIANQFLKVIEPHFISE